MDMLPITIRKRTINEEDIPSIQATVNDHWDKGRTHISKVLCEKWDWRQPNGRLKDMACRDLPVPQFVIYESCDAKLYSNSCSSEYSLSKLFVVKNLRSFLL